MAQSCREAAGLILDEESQERLVELARSYQASRYPDAVPEGTPQEHFGPASSRAAIATARRTVDAVEGHGQASNVARWGTAAPAAASTAAALECTADQDARQVPTNAPWTSGDHAGRGRRPPTARA